MRLVLLATSLVAGCELIADIPDPALIAADARGGDGGVDDGAPEDGAAIDAKVGCDQDSECASGVCLVDRTCAQDTRIVHASPTGGGAACTAAAPCTVEGAVGKLAPGVDIIKLAPGVYERTVQLDLATSVTFAGSGATWHGSNQSFYALLGVSAATVTVIGLDFDLAGAAGIMCSGGDLVLSRTRIHGGIYGLFASQTCRATIDRATFTANNFYGSYFAAGTTAAITNSYYTDHAPTIAGLAALIFEQASGSVANTTLSNNTGTAGAIHCMGAPTPVMTSLVAFGQASPSVEPGCNVSYSVLDPGYAGPGTNNTSTNPGFIGGGNYHLSATSPVRGLGDPASTLARDGDGEPRPQPAGSRVDPGADEVP